jgi:glycosyltransferase involved in cell wall biosynthesis
MPKISVIVPVYNVEKYLDRCVESVVAQTFTDFELILVDDGSPDNCPQMCDEWAKKDDRIIVIHQENGGLSAARNAGIDWAFQNSDSQWITFIDSDDWVNRRYLESLYNATIDNNLLIGFGKYYLTDGSDFVEHTEFSSEIVGVEDFFIDNNILSIIACAKLFSKSLFYEVRFPVGKIHEDEFTIYKLLFNVEKIVVVHQPIYYYYRNSQGIIGSNSSFRRTDAFDAFEEQIGFFSDKGLMRARKVVCRRYINSLLTRIQLLEGSGDYPDILFELKNKKKCNAKKYARYLNPNDPNDEFVLMKLYPIRTKINIYIRALKKKLGIQ